MCASSEDHPGFVALWYKVPSLYVGEDEPVPSGSKIEES